MSFLGRKHLRFQSEHSAALFSGSSHRSEDDSVSEENFFFFYIFLCHTVLWEEEEEEEEKGTCEYETVVTAKFDHAVTVGRVPGYITDIRDCHC